MLAHLNAHLHGLIRGCGRMPGKEAVAGTNIYPSRHRSLRRRVFRDKAGERGWRSALSDLAFPHQGCPAQTQAGACC